MASHELKLRALAANAAVAIVEANRVKWGWEEKYAKFMIGKLSRGTKTIGPLEAEAALTIISMASEGWGLYNALKRAKITQRRFFAWILQGHSVDPADEPYREFRLRIIEAADNLAAKTGRRDDATRRMLGIMPAETTI